MEACFDASIAALGAAAAGLSWTLNFAAESSDFIRFNKGVVRQPGTVHQAVATIRLLDLEGRRHARRSVTLSGDAAEDAGRIQETVALLRERLAVLPPDPHLLLPPDLGLHPTSTSVTSVEALPSPEEVVAQVVSAAARGGAPLDLVGIYAGGPIFRGFAASWGQRNWFATSSCSLDWSVYLSGDKAVKSTVGGRSWSPAAFTARLEEAVEELEILARPARVISPGSYRAFLTPAALGELWSLVASGGFSQRSFAARTTPLLKMLDGGEPFHPSVQLAEDTALGYGPAFQDDGFLRPDRVALVRDGKLVDRLVSPRSAQEYSVPTNGADDSEVPASLAMAPGSLPAGQALAALGEGIWCSNLWYTNYSDRASCRITGMTRFATFWVEGGKKVAPLSVMRFDDTLPRLLGPALEGLTDVAEPILSTSTYSQRNTEAQVMPGALVSSMRFTL